MNLKINLLGGCVLIEEATTKSCLLFRVLRINKESWLNRQGGGYLIPI